MDIPKVIYMTYKKVVPDYVFERWQTLNPDYKIDFSLDSDCFKFLLDHFGEDISNLFNRIFLGMFKADLWRLCKLYVYGGIYADIDLVPYLSIDSIMNEKNSLGDSLILDKADDKFYSILGMDKDHIFQAFFITTPRNPILLQFILSFIQNRPYMTSNGPTFDMYNCIKYNIPENINHETKYNITKVNIILNIGTSNSNVKKINLYNFKYTDYTFELVKHQYTDTFDIRIDDNFLVVRRTDKNEGWGHNHIVDIIIKSKQSIFLFTEFHEGTDWQKSIILYNNKKIMDSRDWKNYDRNIGFL